MANEGDILKSVSNGVNALPLSPQVTDFERGERTEDGRDVSRSTISQSPISFEILRRPILASGRGSRRAPGFIGTLDEKLDFFAPLVEPPPPPPDPDPLESSALLASSEPVRTGGEGGTASDPENITRLSRVGDADLFGSPNTLGPAAPIVQTPAFRSAINATAAAGRGVGPGGGFGPGQSPGAAIGPGLGLGEVHGDGGGVGGGTTGGGSVGGGAPGDMGGAEAGAPGGTGDPGGDPSGDKIICTELYRQGLLGLQERQWSYRGTMMLCRPVTVRGYHFWAMPVVRALRRRRWRAFWTFVVQHRARELAFRLALRDRPDRIGQAMRVLFEPISFVVGLGLEILDRVPDVGSLYDHQYPRI